MGNDAYVSRLIMLSGVQAGSSGFARVSKQRGRFTLQFRAIGLTRQMDGATAQLVSIAGDRKLVCGTLRVDGRGQGGLLKEMEETKLGDIEDFDTVVVTDGEGRALLAGNIAGGTVKWEALRRLLLRDMQRVVGAASSGLKVAAKAVSTKVESSEEIVPEGMMEAREDLEEAAKHVAMEAGMEVAHEMAADAGAKSRDMGTGGLMKEGMIRAPDAVLVSARDVDEELMEQARALAMEEEVVVAPTVARSGEEDDLSIEWPEEAREVRAVFEKGTPCEGPDAPNCRFVQTSGAGRPRSLIGIRVDQGKVVAAGDLLEGQRMPEPPPGLPGYEFAKIDDEKGYWARWREFEKAKKSE